jgi:hypothetical protein
VGRRHLVPLAIGVTALLSLVAVVAGGRPLSAHRGRSGGLPAAFYDYAFTTFIILVFAAALAGVIARIFYRPPNPRERQGFARRTSRSLAFLFFIAVLLVYLGRHVNLYHLLHPNGTSTTSTQTTATGPLKLPRTPPRASRHAQFRWEELAIVLGLLLLLGAVAARRSRLNPAFPRPDLGPELLAASLDESLDDLRSEPDLRRAIVAAYARMEAALGAAGLPRHPAEAPLEYLERALLALEASAPAVRRLTDLFQWARFSQHDPEPRMRDEAVDALVAVRDELRASELLAT